MMFKLVSQAGSGRLVRWETSLYLNPFGTCKTGCENMSRLTTPICILTLAALGQPAMAEAPSVAAAATPEEKGRAIAEESHNRDVGWGDSESRLTMTLRNRHGDSSVRDLRQRSLEIDDEKLGDRSIMVFDKPRDIAGTALLIHSNVLEPDDQWIFLPVLKRVKRIASRNKSGSFMGSEFSYEDMMSSEVSRYSYKWLRDEACGDLTCHVFERYPLYEFSGYTKQVVWADANDYQPRKVEFYDRKDALLKTMEFKDYTQHLGEFWRAQVMDMVNHQTGKSTTLTVSDLAFKVGLTEDDFRKDRLTRIR